MFSICLDSISGFNSQLTERNLVVKKYSYGLKTKNKQSAPMTSIALPVNPENIFLSQKWTTLMDENGWPSRKNGMVFRSLKLGLNDLK